MLVSQLLTSLILPWSIYSQTSGQQPLTSQGQGIISSNDKLSDVIAESRFLSFHRKLVEIESISDNEFDIGNYLADLLERHDFLVTRQQVPQEDTNNNDRKKKPKWNIYVTPNPDKFPQRNSRSKQSKPKVLLTSHIDTVPPYISYSLSVPKSKSGHFKREDILVSGRGTVDAKACVAAQVTAVNRLLHDPEFKGNPSDLALLFVVDEEVGGDGMRFFSESKLYAETKADYKAIIFGEPTEAKLASGHKGITSLSIVAEGKAAHSGYPWLGRSALSMILPALTALDNLGDLPEEEGGLPRSHLFGNSTVNVGFVQGGVAANVVAKHAEAKVSFRLAGGTSKQSIELATKAVRAVDPEELLRLSFHEGYGPVLLDDDVPGFENITVNYGTDIPNLKVDRGVKRYLYGPGSILVAHGDNEGLTIGELEKAVEDYQRLVKHALSL